MDKNEIIETLAVMGFEVEEIPEFGFMFRHEGLAIVYMPDDDGDFLRFAAPNIYDVTEDNRTFIMDVVNDTNMTIKYSKVCIYGDQVWAFYEYRVFGEGHIEDILEHSLMLLHATVSLFHRKIEGGDFDFNDDDNEEEGGE